MVCQRRAMLVPPLTAMLAPVIHEATREHRNSSNAATSVGVPSLPSGCRRNKLYARDVVAIPLNAELVTPSTCRSAGTRTFPGERLVGCHECSECRSEARHRRVMAGRGRLHRRTDDSSEMS